MKKKRFKTTMRVTSPYRGVSLFQGFRKRLLSFIRKQFDKTNRRTEFFPLKFGRELTESGKEEYYLLDIEIIEDSSPNFCIKDVRLYEEKVQDYCTDENSI